MKRAILALSTVFVFLGESASAHTGAGGASGFSSGFLHPVGGLDHVLAMVAVGLLAAQQGGRSLWLVPAAFVAMMIAGGILGAFAVGVPLVEVGIVGSVVILGAVIALGRQMPVAAAMGLVGVFAIFHGHAHGTEMPDTASGLAYGVGFVIATSLLHAAGIGLGLAAQKVAEKLAPVGVRVGGGVIAAAGCLLFVA